MSGLTPEQLMTTVYVLLTVFAGIVTVDKVVDIYKKWRSPSTDTAQKLANDKRRLDEHDRAIRNLQESANINLKGTLALLDHELHNGNSEQMQTAHDEIMSYLQSRLTC